MIRENSMVLGDRLTFSIAETSRILGLAEGSTYRAARSGAIPSVKIRGRILVPKAALHEMLARAGDPTAARS